MSVSFLPPCQEAVFGLGKPKDTLIFSTPSNTTFGHTSFYWISIVTFFLGASLAGYILWRSRGWHEEKVDGYKIQMWNVVQALDAYKVQFGEYPDKLEALVEKGVMPSLPLDRWERPFHYQLKSETSFRITSFGRDGRPGCTGADEDVVIP